MTVDVKGFGKITASKEVLNKIICLMYESAMYTENEAEKYDDEETKEVFNKCAGYTRGYAGQIYNELEKVGMYDKEVK